MGFVLPAEPGAPGIGFAPAPIEGLLAPPFRWAAIPDRTMTGSSSSAGSAAMASSTLTATFNSACENPQLIVCA